MYFGLNPPRSGRRFCTVAEAFSTNSVYWGESQDWFIVAAVNRDSDTLDESNFQVLRQLIPTAKIERANHWACGWVDYLLVAPTDRAALRAAITAQKRAENYPILDDEHFSNLEYEKFYQYAASELRNFTNWEQILEEELQASNSGPGDEMAEGNIIEAARERLEAEEPLWENHTASPIDPRQDPLPFVNYAELPHN